MESSTSNATTTALIIDNGTGTIKAGIAGDDAPRAIFPTIVGKPNTPGLMVGTDQKDIYFGNEVKEKKSSLKVSYPIVRGEIQDWDDMEKVWGHTIFHEMRTTPDEQALLLTETPLNSKENRERMTRIMFESFKVPYLYIGIQSVLALYASGRTTGLVIDSGEGVTHTVPIYEGYAIPHAIQKIPLAGSDLTLYLKELLSKSDKLPPNTELETYQMIKEKLCMVAMDYDTEFKEINDKKLPGKSLTLPDGNTITLGVERLQVPELLFQPMLRQKTQEGAQQEGTHQEGIHRYAEYSVKKCDRDISKELYKNVILSGGSTMFGKMGERLVKEIRALAPSSATIEKFAPPERKNSVWIGGSIVASLEHFGPMFITRAEYKEVGVEIVHSKCF